MLHFVPLFTFWFLVSCGMLAAHPQIAAGIVGAWAFVKLWRYSGQ